MGGYLLDWCDVSLCSRDFGIADPRSLVIYLRRAHRASHAETPTARLTHPGPANGEAGWRSRRAMKAACGTNQGGRRIRVLKGQTAPNVVRRVGGPLARDDP